MFKPTVCTTSLPFSFVLIPFPQPIPFRFLSATCFSKVLLRLNFFYSRLLYIPLIMTRTVKGNDRNHAGLADGTAIPEDRLPRYFAKSGHVDADPKSVKKSGGGKGNWGREGDEVQDYDYNFTNDRRRSNSSTQALNEFKTKFEANDTDPVFEEDVHGPTEEDMERASTLSKEESNDSSSYGGSVAEDDGFKKM